MDFHNYIKNALPLPALIITVGLPATGKSTVAKKIAQDRKIKLYRTDEIRKEILKEKDLYNDKIAGDMKVREIVYSRMFTYAEEMLQKIKKSKIEKNIGKQSVNGVLLDATFITQKLRLKAAHLAAKYQVLFIIIETCCSEKKAKTRIQARNKKNTVSNALSPLVYDKNQEIFEPIKITEIKHRIPLLNIVYIEVDTDKAIRINRITTI